MTCLHGGGGSQVGQVTSALFNVHTFFAKILALFIAVSKRNEISWKYIRKCEMSRKSVPENGSEIENQKSPNVRKF